MSKQRERVRRVNAKRPRSVDVRLESAGTQALDDAAEILIRWMDELEARGRN